MDGKVMKAYGVYREDRRIANRAYFIVDKDGIVRYKHIPESGAEKFLLSTETLLNEAKKVNKGS
jgi:alkyl hydroperoxide reductase subunit AhpC